MPKHPAQSAKNIERGRESGNDSDAGVRGGCGQRKGRRGRWAHSTFMQTDSTEISTNTCTLVMKSLQSSYRPRSTRASSSSLFCCIASEDMLKALLMLRFNCVRLVITSAIVSPRPYSINRRHECSQCDLELGMTSFCSQTRLSFATGKLSIGAVVEIVLVAIGMREGRSFHFFFSAPHMYGILHP